MIYYCRKIELSMKKNNISFAVQINILKFYDAKEVALMIRLR